MQTTLLLVLPRALRPLAEWVEQGRFGTHLSGLLFGLFAFGGLALAVVFARLLAGTLYGVTATDPWPYLLLPAVVVAATAAAALLPTRRALAVDPAAALRSE